MTVLQNAYNDDGDHDSQLKGVSIDKNKLVKNWIGEEMQKFDQRQGIALQNLNELSLIRKMESQRNLGQTLKEHQLNESMDIKRGLVGNKSSAAYAPSFNDAGEFNDMSEPDVSIHNRVGMQYNHRYINPAAAE